MFRKLATVRLFQSRRMAPLRASAFNDSHSNDNRPGFRRPADRRARPKPSLVCHWIEVGGRLECRWDAAGGNGASRNDAEPRPPGPFASSRRHAA
jgi:hypothetical protein